jgi:tetratricopeptide (TPR) repeat protein
LGETEEAIEYLERATPGAVRFPEIYYVLGRAYRAAENSEKAAESFKRFRSLTAEDRQKRYAEVKGDQLVGLGIDALDQNNSAQAREYFQQALEYESDNWAAHGYLAEIYLAQNSLHQAYGHLVKMESNAPDSATVHFLMARYWYARRDYQRACTYAEKVRDVRPNNSRLRNLLGNIYMALRRFPEAVQEYTLAVKFDPDRTEFRLNLETAKKRSE